MSAALGLHRLQELDRTIDRVRAELDANRRNMEDDSLLRQARDRQQGGQREFAAARQNLETAESAAATLRAKIEQVEASLYGGQLKNPKELEELQAEAAALRRHLAKLEDAELEAMGVAETAEHGMRESESDLQRTQASAGGDQQRLLAEREQLSRELERLGMEREAAVADVAAALRESYEQLRRSKRGVAVAEVAEDACSACGTSLGAALVQVARSMHTLAHCPTCGRILYAP